MISENGKRLPVMSIACQDDTGAWVSIARHPSAVHHKEHQQHDEQHRSEGTKIGSNSFGFLWLSADFANLASLFKCRVKRLNWRSEVASRAYHLIIEFALLVRWAPIRGFVILGVFQFFLLDINKTGGETLGECNSTKHTNDGGQSEHETDHDTSKVGGSNCIQSYWAREITLLVNT